MFLSDNLRRHVKYLSSEELQGREFLSNGNKLAAEYVANRFKEYGIVAPSGYPDYMQKTPQGGQNVVGILLGNNEELSDECVIIEAHHDHMGDGFVGASDNAAGVALLLELARHFSDMNDNKRSIVFACFDAEEQFLMVDGKEELMHGANSYIQNPVYELKKTAAMLTMDTLGRNDLEDNFIFILGSERSLFIQDTIDACETDLRKIMFSTDLLTGVKGNYIPFVDKKVPSLFISNGLHVDYHTVNDTEEKLQYDLLLNDAELISRLLPQIASAPRRPDFCKSPIPPKTQTEDILYMLKLLQDLMRKQHNSAADQFDYIIEKLEGKASGKDVKQAVQIILGFMTPNFAKFYLLLNDAQIAEKEKNHEHALQKYRDILELYQSYRVPNLWIEGIREKVTKLEEKIG